MSSPANALMARYGPQTLDVPFTEMLTQPLTPPRDQMLGWAHPAAGAAHVGLQFLEGVRERRVMDYLEKERQNRDALARFMAWGEQEANRGDLTEEGRREFEGAFWQAASGKFAEETKDAAKDKGIGGFFRKAILGMTGGEMKTAKPVDLLQFRGAWGQTLQEKPELTKTYWGDQANQAFNQARERAVAKFGYPDDQAIKSDPDFRKAVAQLQEKAGPEAVNAAAFTWNMGMQTQDQYKAQLMGQGQIPMVRTVAEQMAAEAGVPSPTGAPGIPMPRSEAPVDSSRPLSIFGITMPGEQPAEAVAPSAPSAPPAAEETQPSGMAKAYMQNLREEMWGLKRTPGFVAVAPGVKEPVGIDYLGSVPVLSGTNQPANLPPGTKIARTQPLDIGAEGQSGQVNWQLKRGRDPNTGKPIAIAWNPRTLEEKPAHHLPAGEVNDLVDDLVRQETSARKERSSINRWYNNQVVDVMKNREIMSPADVQQLLGAPGKQGRLEVMRDKMLAENGAELENIKGILQSLSPGMADRFNSGVVSTTMNPGNIKDPSTGDFLEFSSWKDGHQSLLNHLLPDETGRIRIRGITTSNTIGELAQSYAPAPENVPENWASNVVSQLRKQGWKVDQNTKLSDIPAAALADGIMNAEGTLRAFRSETGATPVYAPGFKPGSEESRRVGSAPESASSQKPREESPGRRIPKASEIPF